MQKNIFITLEGGLIQNIDISADLQDIKIIVIDLDTDGVPDDELKILPGGDFAVVFEHILNIIGDGDVDIFEEILKNI